VSMSAAAQTMTLSAGDRRLRIASRLVAALVVSLSLATTGLSIALRDSPAAVGGVILISFPIVAVMITRVQPRNGVAWVFLTASFLDRLNQFGDRLARFAVLHGWPDVIAHTGAWVTILWFPALFLLITLGLLYFPSGRLPGRTWRAFEIASVAVMASGVIFVGIPAWLIPTRELLSSATPSPTGWKGVLFVIGECSIFAIVPCVLGAAVSLVLRWRRSDGIQRLQIRWFVAAAAVAIIAEIVIDVLHVGDSTQAAVESSAFSLIAIATGFAILRYRLYDIDRLISRTLSYAIVTGALVGLYALLVTLTTKAFQLSSPVGVAAATLATAAVFNPLRRRTQHVVDRRFNRTRYRADELIDEFRATVAAAHAFGDVNVHLLDAVQRSLQPTTAALWLKPITGSTATRAR
jgi:hypothetical protein